MNGELPNETLGNSPEEIPPATSTLIASTEAGRRFGITNDYIARLCREGKVDGVLDGRTWCVNEQSLASYLSSVHDEQERRAQELAKMRREEYLASQSMLSAQQAAQRFGVTNDYISRLCREGKIAGKQVGRTWYVGVPVLEAFFERQHQQQVETAMALSLARQQEYHEHARTTPWLAPALVALCAILTVGSGTALAFGGAFDHVPVLGEELRVMRGLPALAEQEPAASRAVVPAASGILAANVPASAPAAATTSVTNVYNTYNNTTKNEYKTYNNSYTVAATSSGASAQDLAYLESQIGSLRQSLDGLSANGSLPASGGFGNALALSQRIDNLSGVTLSGVTFTGAISGLTDADIPDDITASQYLALSGGMLTGNLGLGGALLDSADSAGTAGYVLLSTGTSTRWVATSTLGILGDGTGGGIGANPGGAATQIQFNDGGSFGGSPAFTFSTSTQVLSVTNASSTHATTTTFFAVDASTTNATSTNLFASVGTFTRGVIGSLSASVADITGLVASSATTSRLAITSAPSAILKTDADGVVVPAIAGTDYLATTSLAAYLPLASWYATTTDALAEGAANKYFTDARVQTYLNSLDKGYFYSTTSADYWLTQQNVSGFSTTSADFWLGTKSTTNLAEGSNLYFTPARATNSFITNLAA
ncbi:MAG TPA: helix-turn-helix domain-containing protein, partial [Candidatus Paceibacterota bacterium]|nr:helix-turn-helix domain-containing protein [Candidatus Paceibacterota bacterium]